MCGYIYLDEYTFLVLKRALNFACTSHRNPHSGAVWALEVGDSRD